MRNINKLTASSLVTMLPVSLVFLSSVFTVLRPVVMLSKSPYVDAFAFCALPILPMILSFY